MKRLLMLLLLTACTTTFAADATLVVPQFAKQPSEPVEGDALQAKYDAAWAKYAEAVGKATAAVNKALDDQFAKAADAGNLELADMWDRKKKFFLDTQTLEWPSDGKAKVEWRKANPKVDFPDDFSEVVASAKQAYAAAIDALRVDYEALVRDYTKERNLERAKQLREEMAVLSNKPVAALQRPRMVEGKEIPQKGRPGLEQLQGVWVAVAVDRHGTMMTPQDLREQNRRIIIDGSTLTFEETRDGKLSKFGGAITVDPDKKTLDLVGKGPGGADFNLLCIYELNGDELKFCYRRNVDGKAKRPTEFKAFKESPNSSISYTCKRLTLK